MCFYDGFVGSSIFFGITYKKIAVNLPYSLITGLVSIIISRNSGAELPPLDKLERENAELRSRLSRESK